MKCVSPKLWPDQMIKAASRSKNQLQKCLLTYANKLASLRRLEADRPFRDWVTLQVRGSMQHMQIREAMSWMALDYGRRRFTFTLRSDAIPNRNHCLYLDSGQFKVI